MVDSSYSEFYQKDAFQSMESKYAQLTGLNYVVGKNPSTLLKRQSTNNLSNLLDKINQNFTTDSHTKSQKVAHHKSKKKSTSFLKRILSFFHKKEVSDNRIKNSGIDEQKINFNSSTETKFSPDPAPQIKFERDSFSSEKSFQNSQNTLSENIINELKYAKKITNLEREHLQPEVVEQFAKQPVANTFNSLKISLGKVDFSQQKIKESNVNYNHPIIENVAEVKKPSLAFEQPIASDFSTQTRINNNYSAQQNDHLDIYATTNLMPKLQGKKIIFAEPEIETYIPTPEKKIKSAPITKVKTKKNTVSTFVLITLPILLFLAGAFIKYPEKLNGTTSITTSPVPIFLKSGSSGRIDSLFASNEQTVERGSPILVLENAQGYREMVQLIKLKDTLRWAFEKNDYSKIKRNLNSNIELTGDTKINFEHLKSNLLDWINMNGKLVSNDHYDRDFTHESTTISNELDQLEMDSKNNEQLYEDQVLSKQEYLEKIAQIRQQRNSISEKENSLQQKKQINSKLIFNENETQKNKKIQAEKAIQSALFNLESYIQNWQNKYVISAPIKSEVHFTRPLAQKEPVAAGEEIIALLVFPHKYFANLSIPEKYGNKIKKGQLVTIALDKYPVEQYGYLKGKVLAKSDVPFIEKKTSTTQQTCYKVIIDLPDSLISSTHSRLQFTPDMGGNGTIITKNKSTFARIKEWLFAVN